MRLPLRLLLVLGVLAPLRASAPPWPLPPVDGELEGSVASSLIPQAPPLHWHWRVATVERDSRHVELAIDGAGTRIRAEADVNLATWIASWKINELTVDLAHWSGTVKQRVPATAGLTLSGTLSVSGSGVLQGNVPTGEVAVALREAAIRNPKEGWTVEGLALGGRFSLDPANRQVRSTEPLTLTVRTITTKRFGARNLTAHGRLRGLDLFALDSARIEIAGGDLVAAPTEIPLDPVRIVVDLTINRIGLQDVAALVPSAVSDARGRVDGSVRIGWSREGGLEIGHGQLTLRKDEPAQVTLRPFPRLFTQAFPEILFKIPSWLVRWSLPSLRKAEMGEAPIEANSLEVTFSPQPDAEGRTAEVHLTGIPHGSDLVTPVDITAHVYGPLKPLIHLGTSTDFTMGIH